MALINPYIHFNGNAEEAFTLYKSVFGGEFDRIVRYKDMAGPDQTVPENDGKRIMHIALPIGTSNLLMGSDVMESMGQVNEKDNRHTISISAASREEADHLFNGLAVGGSIEMPIADAPWGSYFGMLTDKFGIEWMVNYEPK